MNTELFSEDLNAGNLQMLLVKISHLYFAGSYEKLTKLGLHPGQVPMLRLLSKKGNLSQREIAEALHVKPPSVAVSIKRMESAGLLERKPDVKDQRITRISLSPKGKETADAIYQLFLENADELFQGFTESEQHLLRRFLLQIIKNLEEMKKC